MAELDRVRDIAQSLEEQTALADKIVASLLYGSPEDTRAHVDEYLLRYGGSEDEPGTDFYALANPVEV